jgi:putative flippase GtrA
VLLGFSTILANTLNLFIITATAFLLHKYFTYRVAHHSWRQPLFFMAVSLSYYFIETTLLVLLIDVLSVAPPLAKFGSIALLSPFGFVLNKHLVFK